MNQLIDFLAMRFGIDPALIPVYLGLLVAVANVVGKSIPISATGYLAMLRKVCLVIGLYVPQKITPNVSTKTVAESIAAAVPDAAIQASASKLTGSVHLGEDATEVARALNDSIQGRNDIPQPGDAVPDEFRTDGPFERGKDKFQ